MPIFRPLASLLWEECEVTYRHGTSGRFAVSHNEIMTSSLPLLGRDNLKAKFVHIVEICQGNDKLLFHLEIWKLVHQESSGVKFNYP